MNRSLSLIAGALVLCANSAFATGFVVNQLTISVSEGGNDIVSLSDAVTALSFTGASSGGYTVSSGEVCVQGFCSAGGGPADDPFTISLTSVTITCTLSSGSCPSMNVSFGSNDMTAASADPVTVRFAGTYVGTTDLTVEYGASIFWGLNSEDDLDSLTFSPGAIDITRNPFGGLYDVNSFGVGITLDFILAAGDSLTFPSSADIIFNPAMEGVPEPSTMLLVGAPLAGMIAWRRRRKK